MTLVRQSFAYTFVHDDSSIFNLSFTGLTFNLVIDPNRYIPHGGGIGYWRIGTEFEPQ